MKKKIRSLRVYVSSELYSLKHLIGNAYLAESIYDKSHGRYLCELPQDLEPGGSRPRMIRDQDIKILTSCDLALFIFDGAEIDSATAIEFLYAKFADIPAVILRTDLRDGGDGSNSWTLMASYYPRTISVVANSLESYKKFVKRRQRNLDPVSRLAGQHSSADAQRACEEMAAACVRAFERACKLEPAMPKHLREQVYQWLALMPGLRGKRRDLRREFEKYLESKVEKDLL